MCELRCYSIQIFSFLRNFIYMKHYQAKTLFSLLALPLAVSNAWAANLHYDKVYLRDYLDLAKNKGQFRAGATDVVITLKDGQTLRFPSLPIPDFSPVSKKGATTSIGGGYYVTATHNQESLHAVKTQTWGNTDYHHAGWETQGDFAAGRLDKFVVETQGLVNSADTKLSDSEFLDRYGVDFNGKKRVMGFRVGAGHTYFSGNGQKEDTGQQYNPELLSGSLFEVVNRNLANNRVTDFINITEGGDSGSGYFLYDNVRKEWVLYGTHLGIQSDANTSSIINIVDQATIDRVKNRFTENVNLAGQTAVYSADQLSAGSVKIAGKGKDWNLTGGGTIILKDNLDLGVGGLLFDAEKEYTVASSDLTSTSFKGAGVDIGAGTTVHWNVTGNAGDNLHKIGKGTLEVNVAQGNNLKTGDGTVILKAEKAFNNIYITSGRATVRVEHEKALQQSGHGGIFFGQQGGTLDLNGFDQSFDQIAANDVGTIITNTNKDHTSTVTLTGDRKRMMSGRFEGNVDINYKMAKKEVDQYLIMNGGTDTTGSVNVENSKLVLQGHATEHAIFREGGVKCQLQIGQHCLGWEKDYVAQMQGKDKASAEAHGEGYRTNNERNSFEQPDWDTRIFKFETVNLINADLHIGRNSVVEGNINATDATVSFGGDADVYLDKHDGSNLTGEGFGFRQDVAAGKSRADDTISYRGNITGNNTKLDSYAKYLAASWDLSGNSVFINHRDDVATEILAGGINVKDTSRVELADAFIKGQSTLVPLTSDHADGIKLRNLDVDQSKVSITNAQIGGWINAKNSAEVSIDHWNFNDNLLSDESSKFVVRNFNVAGGTRNMQGHLEINNLLDLGDLSRNFGVGPLGFHSTGLTLNTDATLKAELTADVLSLNNFEFNKGYDLVTSDNLVDNRADKNLDLTKNNSNLFYSTATIDNRIELKFYDKEPQDWQDLTPSKPVPPPPVPNPDPVIPTPPPVPNPDPVIPTPPPVPNPDPVIPTPPTDGERYDAVMEAYALQYGDDPTMLRLIDAIIENNKTSSNKYQEVALRDALLNNDAQAGAQALHQIVRRSSATFEAMSRTTNPQQLFQPVRLTVDSRLAMLASDRTSTEKREKFFIDTGVGYYDNGNRGGHLNYQQTAFGWDTSVASNGGFGIVGFMAGIGHTSNSAHGMSLSGELYTATGYGTWTLPSGYEFSNFLSFAFLDGTRKVTPEIRLGMQRFDEKAYTVMNSTYVKRPFVLNDTVTIKPMLSLDLANEWTESTESAYFKRDGATKMNAWLGLGAEIDWKLANGKLYGQMLGRRVLTSTDHTVDVTLSGSSTYIATKMDDIAPFSYDVRMIYSQDINDNSSVNVGITGTADSEGGMGAGAQLRFNYRF